MPELERGRRKARQLIAAAKHEKTTTGYRENLGYDQYGTLLNYLGKLSLAYIEETNILRKFTRACDAL